MFHSNSPSFANIGCFKFHFPTLLCSEVNLRQRLQSSTDFCHFSTETSGSLLMQNQSRAAVPVFSVGILLKSDNRSERMGDSGSVMSPISAP